MSGTIQLCVYKHRAPFAPNPPQRGRFQEAYLDPGDRAVLGVRLRDRNPRMLACRPNKYGADLVW